MEERGGNITVVNASSGGICTGCSIIRPKEKKTVKEKKDESLNLDHCTRNRKYFLYGKATNFMLYCTALIYILLEADITIRFKS